MADRALLLNRPACFQRQRRASFAMIARTLRACRVFVLASFLGGCGVMNAVLNANDPVAYLHPLSTSVEGRVGIVHHVVGARTLSIELSGLQPHATYLVEVEEKDDCWSFTPAAEPDRLIRQRVQADQRGISAGTYPLGGVTADAKRRVTVRGCTGAEPRRLSCEGPPVACGRMVPYDAGSSRWHL